MRKIVAVFVRDAKLALAYPVDFTIQWISIIVSVTGFYYVSKLVAPSRVLGVGGHSGDYFTYVTINLAFMTLQTSALQSFSTTIRRDQMLGTMESILATSSSVPVLALSAGLWTLTISTLQVIAYLTLAALLFGLHLRHMNMPGVLLFTLLGVACMTALGIISAAFVVAYRQQSPTNFLIGGAASLLSGVLFPVTLLPLPLQLFSWCLPATHALAGLRAVATGAQLGVAGYDACWLGVASLILLPLAFVLFGRAIDRAKHDGTLAYT